LLFFVGVSQCLPCFLSRPVGEDERTGQLVAVKIINRKKMREMLGANNEKVVREISNLRRLVHPHICRL
jgi:hypothetical protein